MTDFYNLTRPPLLQCVLGSQQRVTLALRGVFAGYEATLEASIATTYTRTRENTDEDRNSQSDPPPPPAHQKSMIQTTVY